MNCANCRNNIPDPPPRSAGIWVEVMGDEYGFGYVECPACGFYTESSSRDSITGGDMEYSPRAITKEKGDEIVRLIETCPDRSDKRCSCPVHQKFRESPPRRETNHW